MMSAKMSKGTVASGNTSACKKKGGYPLRKPDGSGAKPVKSYPDAGNKEDLGARGMR